MKKYQHLERTLSNKLRVLYLPVPESPAVYISLTGKVGRRAELSNEIGSAHFLEHLFFDGTAKRPTALQLSEFIEGYGGLRNGSTGSEEVQYWVKVLSEDREVGFEYLSDIFFNSLLEEIEKERKVIGQEVAMNQDNPSRRLGRLIKSNLFPNQPIGRTIFDEAAHLPHINKETLLNYRNRTYLANNFILAIAGNIDKDEALKLAKEYFSKFKEGQEALFKKAEIEKNRKIHIVNGDFKQSKVAVSFRGCPANTREEKIIALLNVIFGQGGSSRLSNRIRHELNLAYSVGSDTSFFSDTGFLTIETSVDETNLQRATEEIFSEIQKLLKHGISEEELEKAKSKLLARTLFGLESLSFYANGFISQWLWGKEIKGIEEELNEVKEATKEDIMEVASYVFSDKPKINILTKSVTSLSI